MSDTTKLMCERLRHMGLATCNEAAQVIERQSSRIAELELDRNSWRALAESAKRDLSARSAAPTGDREFHEAAVQLVRDMMDSWQAGTPYRELSMGTLARINALLTAPVLADDTAHLLASQANSARLSHSLAQFQAGQMGARPLADVRPGERAASEDPPRLSDADIDTVAESMPGGIANFMKQWGWRQFARAIEDEVQVKCAAARTAAPHPALTVEVRAFLENIAKAGSEPLNSAVGYKDKASRMHFMGEIRNTARALLASAAQLSTETVDKPVQSVGDAPTFEGKHVSLKQNGSNLMLTLELDALEGAPRYAVTPINPAVVRAGGAA